MGASLMLPLLSSIRCRRRTPVLRWRCASPSAPVAVTDALSTFGRVDAMSLTEKSRSALYSGLSNIVDEEAVEEMLSFFPARDVEEPVTKEFLRAEMATSTAGLRLEMRAVRDELRDELHSEIGGLRTEFREELGREIGGLRTEIGGLRTEIGGLRTEVRAELRSESSALRSEMRRLMWVNVGMFVAFAGVIIAAVRI